MILKKQKEKGFTLMEIIVAMFVFSIGLVAILGLATMSLRASTTSKLRLIAAGLAQEGMELVRDVRNSNSDWDNWEWYGSRATSTSQDYLVQYDDSVLLTYAETPLKLNSGTGLYQYDSGNDTQFYRKVTLTKVSSHEVKVLVEVKWSSQGQWHYLIAEDRLWKWRGS